MSRAQGNKLYSNFSRGLITEATPLAFPENATIGELNCDIQENGKRVRRRGFTRSLTSIGQTNYLRQATNDQFTGSEVVETYLWKSVSKDETIDYLVLRSEGVIYFWLCSDKNNWTNTGLTINLSAYKVSGATDAEVDGADCQYASGRGELFIVNPYLEPLRVTVDLVGATLDVEEVVIRVRDFVGVQDSLGVSEEPTTLSAEHNYNLRNQGWNDPDITGATTSISEPDFFSGIFRSWNQLVTDDGGTTYRAGPIKDYFTQHSRYPSNSQVWWYSKDSSTGNFDAAGLAKLYFGNGRAPRGHFVFNFFDRDRSAVSGIPGLTAETFDDRFTTVAFGFSRVFWGYKSNILFSPTLEDGSRAGQCFQEADPTSETISDLIASDGGWIDIPEAENIVKLVSVGNGIVVFAKNGIWYIESGGKGFSATDYSIVKISENGTSWPNTVVKADDTIFWWSETGIHGMKQAVGQFGVISGQFDQSNLTNSTIQDYYNAIGQARQFAKGFFDPATSKVGWLHDREYDDLYVSNDDTTGGSSKPSNPSVGTLTTALNHRYHNILWFDIELEAFTPYQISQPTGNTLGIGGGFIVSVWIDPNYALDTDELTYVQFLAYERYGAATSEHFNLHPYQFNSTEYTDWGDFTFSTGSGAVDGTVNYLSFVLTGFELLEDGMRRKQAPFVGIFFERTEDSVTDNGDGTYTIDNPSSCNFQARWDWSNSSLAGNVKWSTEVEAYRPRGTPFGQTGNMGYDVVYTRNKVRGSGRSVQFYFGTNEAGKTFRLLGWHVFYEAKTRP